MNQNRSLILAIHLCLLLFFGCSHTDTTSTTTKTIKKIAPKDTVRTDSTVIEEQIYIPSLATICALSEKVIGLKNRYRYTYSDTVIVKDSLGLKKLEKQVYDSIKLYKKVLSTGVKIIGEKPNLVKAEKVTDKLSLRLLPKISKSLFVTGNDFFFLGAGHFINRYYEDNDKAIFSDQQGKPEIRFVNNSTENTNYILDAILRYKKIPIHIAYGAPLPSYDSGEQEVKKIGSLIHELGNRIPVLFFTKSGVVPAQLVSVSKNLINIDLCVYSNPEVIFACSTLPKNEILGVYMPYGEIDAKSCSVSKKNKIWTADINGDGIPDIAGVIGSFTSEISNDTLVQIIWYANINGEWKVIDYAADLDCT